MKGTRAIVVAISAVLVVAGCGKPIEGTVSNTGHYRLYEATTTRSASEVAVIDSRSHAIERKLPLGAPSTDWRHLYTASGSRVTDIDPGSGATLHTLGLPGDYHLPFGTMTGMPGGLSQNGRWLVLQRFDDTPSGPPVGSHLLVIDTSYAKSPARIDLPGYFAFDAISNDGQSLYLIERGAGATYRVRAYDVTLGRLDPNVVFDKNDGTTAMSGERLSSLPSRSGQWLFSIYVREHEAPFIHALDLDHRFAICIDLPGLGSASSDDTFRWSLALSPDGSRLYAANGAMRTVVEIENASSAPAVKRTAHYPALGTTASWFAQDVEAKEFGGTGAVLTPDGGTLLIAGTMGVVWVDTTTLQSRRHALDDERIWGLALSPDGEFLYAGVDAGKIVELPMDGGAAGAFPSAPGGLALLRVEPVGS